ncbi:inositol-pentakisphosphate 2-kinase IPK1-like isoform X2 [Cucurbita moschata]|uniref:Inositol-pentakisphosphate 2-kinase n=1 Tax=Cucurbita moschata TaxID=3662 RepID=A0A6J1F6V8_CUCMO|nr:inositol-pentakisphosphate 2-kinase IPK1-like isoform X2 [Cucurbita moschata]
MLILSAGRVNVHRDSFLLQSDHSIFSQDQLKYGCLPTSRFITKRNFINQNVTRFRMHQALKLQNGEISELRYMPTAIHFDYKIWMLYFADLVRCFIVHCGSMIFMSNKGIDGVHSWHISTDNIWVKVAMVSSFADELMI